MQKEGAKLSQWFFPSFLHWRLGYPVPSSAITEGRDPFSLVLDSLLLTGSVTMTGLLPTACHSHSTHFRAFPGPWSIDIATHQTRTPSKRILPALVYSLAKVGNQCRCGKAKFSGFFHYNFAIMQNIKKPFYNSLEQLPLNTYYH